MVDVWTGRSASALRTALRMTNEGFAFDLGIGVRTVASWSTSPSLVPTPELQRVLDTTLSRADQEARARFALLVTPRRRRCPNRARRTAVAR